MPPKFTDSIAWQQAELLMQPTFIRVIDNLRKQLERSPWKGTYRDTQTWAEDVPMAVQEQVRQLQQRLTEASPAEAADIEQTLSHLPRAIPGYELCLEYQDQQVHIDLWELCYQVCFDGYKPTGNGSKNQQIAIDTSLIDETGDVDWQRLDDKTKQLVEQIFTELFSTSKG